MRRGGGWKKCQDEEWQCKDCGTGNWWSRSCCRECESETTTQSKPKSLTQSFKEAVTGTGLTRQKAETAAKIEALEKAVELVGDNLHLQGHKKAMEDELNKLRKSTNDTRSLAKQIDNLETWIGREQKRIEKLATDLEEALVALTHRRSDLETESAKLIQLKTELTNEEGKDKKEAMDVGGISPEAEADAHMLQEKELILRRQIARKRNQDGKNLNSTQLKEMENEATLICANLEKRRKTASDATSGAAAAARAAATTAAANP